MTTTPRASILIPTHDRSRSLTLAVRSVLNQTVTDLEVLVIGDGVTPRGRAAIEALVDEDPRVVFLDYPKGPSRGEIRRHEAIVAARSDAIMYLCDDDILMPDHVADLLSLLVDHDLVQSLNGTIHPDGHVELYPGVLGDPDTIRWILSDTHRYNTVSVTGTAHTRSAYLGIGSFWDETPPGLWPDHHQWRKMLGSGKVRAATSRRMTALQFPSGEYGRETWTEDERDREVEEWFEFIGRDDAQDRIDQLVLDGVVVQLGRIFREQIDIHSERNWYRGECDRLAAELKKANGVIDDLRERIR